MKRFPVLVTLLTAVAAWSVASPAAAQKNVRAKVDPQPDAVIVMLTGDTAGELTPCNCKVEDLGGLTRRASFFHLLELGGWEFLRVDVGGLATFGPMDVQKALKLEALAKCMEHMDYHAVGLGYRDLALGPETVKQVVGWLGQPVLATNYDLGDSLSVRTRIATERGRRVGIIHLVDEDAAAEHAPWLAVEAWEDQRERVAALEAETDLLVAGLQATGMAAAERAVELFPGIDLVVLGGEGKYREFTEASGVVVIGAASEGKYVIRAELPWDAETGTRSGKVLGTYLPVIKPWGFRPEIDALLAEYNRRLRETMLQSLD